MNPQATPHLFRKFALTLSILSAPAVYPPAVALAVEPKVVVPESVSGVEGVPLYISAVGSVVDPGRKLEWKPDAASSVLAGLIKLNTDDLSGAVALWAAPISGDFRVRVVAKGVPPDAKEIDADAAWVAIKIAPKDIPPPPTPTPTPIPLPDPVVPPPGPPPIPPAPAPPTDDTAVDPYGFAALVKARVAATGWTADAARPAANALAAAFAAQADGAGSYASGQAFLDATAAAAKQALGSAAYAQWRDLLMVPVRAKFADANAKGKLLTTSEIAAAFRTIAAALRGIK